MNDKSMLNVRARIAVPRIWGHGNCVRDRHWRHDQRLSKPLKGAGRLVAESNGEIVQAKA